MPWYIFGMLLVLVTFFPIFHRFIPKQFDENLSENGGLGIFWYTFFPGIFNVGWAAT